MKLEGQFGHFHYGYLGREKDYFIYIFFHGRNYFEDEDIATLLGITKKEYQKELSQFNSYINEGDSYFTNYQDLENAINFLKEEYEMLLKLLS